METSYECGDGGIGKEQNLGTSEITSMKETGGLQVGVYSET